MSAAERSPGRDSPQSPVLPEHTTQASDGTEGKAKRKVAFHVGYVGTGYLGLQIQRGPAQHRTVEGDLEAALHAAGAIRDSNLGDLAKLAWSRSSRTDKGVHSLSTVVALKAECAPDLWDSDPEGLTLAAQVNRHLPPQVRVFAAQRVHKAFHARTQCTSRTYHYYLPVHILGLTGGPGDAEVLARLQACLDVYRGRRAFHNYTSRRLYRAAVRQVSRPNRGSRVDSSDDSESETDEPGAADNGAGQGAVQHTGRLHSVGSSQTMQTSRAHAASPVADASSSGLPEVGTQEAEPDDWRSRPPQPIELVWKAEVDPSDKVEPSHFRIIRQAVASPPLPLVPDAQPCVQITLSGESFMLKQIRHMVGAAVAVARRQLPLELIQASLAVPARITALPLAPPSTLVLADCDFFDFPVNFGTPGVRRWSGEALTLRAGGCTARDRFSAEVLSPALDALLDDTAEWRNWEDQLQRVTYIEADLVGMLTAYEDWRIQRTALAAERAQNMTTVVAD